MRKSCFLILLFVLCLVSCTTSRTVVSNSADVRKYKYASLTDVINYNGSAALMDIEIKIYDALETTRLTMVGKERIRELSPAQKEQLLLVKFSVSQSDEESVVSVNFVDYMTGQPIASCRGAYGFGWNRDGDMRTAIQRVVEQIQILFGLR